MNGERMVEGSAAEISDVPDGITIEANATSEVILADVALA